jgi:hypothetical protein
LSNPKRHREEISDENTNVEKTVDPTETKGSDFQGDEKVLVFIG